MLQIRYQLVRLLLVGLLLLAIVPGAATAATPGLSITGPQAISLNTAYVYRVTAITGRSYNGAALWFSTGDCTQWRRINLTAHHAWRGSFTATLSEIAFRWKPEVIVSIVSLATKSLHARTLLKQKLPLSQSVTAVPASPGPDPPERCQHLVGS